jgi:Cu2+-exporting ATPase
VKVAGGRDCYHCGEPVPDGLRVDALVPVDGVVRAEPVCCIGCKAVAELIHANGLGAYYALRSDPAPELTELRAKPSPFAHNDADDLLMRYVHRDVEISEATVEIGGIYCSAC